MSTLVYMKMLEQTPEKYDRGMRLITLGRIDYLKERIAREWIGPQHEVLEIGCGTGSLAAKMVERGARVTAIDISQKMLRMAQEKAPQAEVLHMTATEIDRFPQGQFNRIVATLSLSELTETELDFVLRTSLKLLKPDGKLIIADEIQPEKKWQWIPFLAVRIPLSIITFLLTQNTTRALGNLRQRLEDKRYEIERVERFLFGSLGLVVARKAK